MKEKPSFADSVTEDYVKVIYSHTEWQPEPITTSVLAARLGLAASVQQAQPGQRNSQSKKLQAS